MKRILGWLVGGAALVLAAGLFLRVSGSRDARPVLGMVFYATPWPVLVGLSLTVTFDALLRRRRKRGLAVALVFGVCAVMWFQHSFLWGGTGGTGGSGGTAGAGQTRVTASDGRSLSGAPVATGERAETLRVVYWNASRPTADLASRIAYLQALQADVLVIGESNVGISNSIRDGWQAGFADRVLTPARGGMLLITPEAPQSFETGSIGTRSNYALARCVVKGRALSLLMVDFDARPTRSRAGAFQDLESLIGATNQETGRIILGDFNTPRESVYFDPIRAHFRDAFESVGYGLAETWPVPLPVLSLDRVWLGAGLRPLRCELGWSLQSDHRAVIVDVAAELAN